jgi:hypothetical protein
LPSTRRNKNPVDDDIERLRAKRGEESVTFAQVADHLRDYVDRHHDDSKTVQRVAAFLAAVEEVDHDHDADARRGLG